MIIKIEISNKKNMDIIKKLSDEDKGKKVIKFSEKKQKYN